MRLGLEPVSQPMPIANVERPALVAPIDHFPKAETNTTEPKDAAATSKSNFKGVTFQRPPFQPYNMNNGEFDLQKLNGFLTISCNF
jgi:hypothetical protein